MRIVGIDASLTGTGICTIRTNRLDELEVEATTIKSKPDDGSIDGRLERLVTLAEQVSSYATRADIAVIEAPALSRNTGHVWDRAGLWWLIVEFLRYEHDVSTIQVTPSQLKKFASGKGNADKTAVAASMVRLWDDVDARNDNEFDALALATVGAVHLGPQRLPFTVLERHRAIVDAIAWPTGVAA